MFAEPAASTRPARIGAFLPLDAGYGREVLRGIARYYRPLPHIQVLKFSQTTRYDLAKLRAHRLDGVIAKIVGRHEEEMFLRLGVPSINFSGQYATQRLPTVTSDDARIGRMAFAHFAQRGFRHYAYCGTGHHWASRTRFEAFSHAVTERFPGSRVSTRFVPDADRDGPFPSHVGRELEDWLVALPKPVAVFTFTDRLGLEIDEVCRRAALRVPHEVGILGVGNDLTRIEFAHVPLSSIELPAADNGYRAAEWLEQWRISGRVPPSRSLIRPRRLVTRASTDALAVPDDRVALALDFIHENLGNAIRVDDVARFAGIARRTLELRFREHLHASIYEMVQNLKFERALELLAHQDVPIKDIADRVGFLETKAFSRAFQKRFHRSPSAYRKGL